MTIVYLKDVATLKLAAEKCTGCGFCVEVCPHQVLTTDGGKVSIADLDLCIECGACVLNCPFDALSLGNTGPG
ncbi:MAG: 4Fe-4S binding protein [Chloroflexi bacterium]|nr:4Fe-4S binding protein [Chloroflexota bacterium]